MSIDCRKHDHLIVVGQYEQVSIGTMGIGTGALVAGMFGMNVSTLQVLMILTPI
jgi:hypothetical protein